MQEILQKVYAIIGESTPLRTDCGLRCSGACCQSGEDDRGMQLFPGEAALLAGQGFRIREGILRCNGVCDRAYRPLACRIFPLTPYMGKNGLSLRMDARAKGLCPLTRGGVEGLDPAFVEKVSAAMSYLYAQPAYRPFLEDWMAAERAVRLLRKKLL